MTSKARFLCLLLILVASGCNAAPQSGPAIDFDSAVNFSEFKTYAWQESDLSEMIVSGLDAVLVDGLIRRAVDNQLAAKGYAAVGEDEADFWVVYHASVEHKIEVSSVLEPSILRSEATWTYRAPVSRTRVTTEVREYDAGTMILYIVDPAAIRPVWQSVMDGVVRRSSSVEQRRNRIEAAVAKMLASFPP